MKTASRLRPIFLEALWEAARERGLSDSALARRLGVHPSLVSRLRGGNYSPTIRTIDAAVVAFPELESVLRADLPNGTDGVQNGTARTDGVAR